MLLWSKIARALVGGAAAEPMPKAILAAALGSRPPSGRFPTDTALVASGMLAGNRLPTPAASTPDQPAPRVVRPTATHVTLFFEFILDNFAPGDMIDADEMAEFYEVFCERNGFVERKWNPIAKELKFLMAPGPQGSSKPYCNILLRDGTYREKRVWFVPARKAAKPQAPRRLRADRQSTPHDVRAAA